MSSRRESVLAGVLSCQYSSSVGGKGDDVSNPTKAFMMHTDKDGPFSPEGSRLGRFIKKNFPHEEVDDPEEAAIRILSKYREHLSGLFTWQRWHDHFKHDLD